MSPRDSAFGFPATVDPGQIRGTDNMALPAANAAIYARVRDAGPISKIGLRVFTQGGNCSVAAYRNSGRGRDAVPAARLATSGAVLVPAVGYVELTLDNAVWVHKGDWLALSADGSVATFHSMLSAGTDNNLGKGRQFRQSTAHPLPALPAGLVATVGYAFVLVGVR